jgi:Ni,Fe-hydrogenase maturation factor
MVNVRRDTTRIYSSCYALNILINVDIIEKRNMDQHCFFAISNSEWIIIIDGFSLGKNNGNIDWYYFDLFQEKEIDEWFIVKK